MEGEQLTEIRKSPSFPIARRISDAIGARTGVVLPDEGGRSISPSIWRASARSGISMPGMIRRRACHLG